MKKALTSAVVCIAMIASSVTSIAADTASSGTPAAQTGPLSPGGPIVVSPAQATDDIFGVVCPNGDCTPLFIGIGVIGMGVGIAAIMGAFNSSKPMPTTVTTTGTGG